MPTAIGEITILHGEATAVMNGEVRQLGEGDAVYEGETLRTAEDGALEVRFQDATVLAQGPDSTLVLDEYVYDPDTGAGEALFQLTQGTFRSVTGTIVDHNPEAFRLQTPLSDIGIRGTSTAHHVPGGGAPEQHLVLVYDGKPVAVVPRDAGDDFRLMAESGSSVAVGEDVVGEVRLLTRAEFEYYQQLASQNLDLGAPRFRSPEEILARHPEAGETVRPQDLERAAEMEAQARGRQQEPSGQDEDMGEDTGEEQGEEQEGEPGGNQADDNQADDNQAEGDQAEGDQAEGDQAGDDGAQSGSAEQDAADVDGNGDANAPEPGLQDARGQDVLLGSGGVLGSATTVIAVQEGYSSLTGTGLDMDGSTQPGSPADAGYEVDLWLDGLLGSDDAEDQDPVLEESAPDPDDPLGPFYGLTYVDFSADYLQNPPAPEDGGSWTNVLGGAGDDVLDGGDGHDQIIGYQGADTLTGGAEDDRLAGGRGDDLLYGDWNGTPAGLEGNDEFLPGPGNDVVDGGGEDYSNPDLGGGDTVLYLEMDARNLWIDLAAGQATYDFEGTAYVDSLIDIENAHGSPNNDTIEGDGGANRIQGGQGDDDLQGFGGDDEFHYEEGDGVDVVDGGAGNDVLGLDQGFSSGVEVEYTGTVDFDVRQNGSLIISATGVEELVLTDRADTVFSSSSLAVVEAYGEAGNDTLSGADMGDLLRGGAGNDSLTGNAGADVLEGGDGDDILVGGTGQDNLSGGSGNDIFRYTSLAETGSANLDSIQDFASGDTLAFDAAGGFDASFSFEAQASYDGQTASATGAHFVLDTSTDTLWYDADGSGAGAGVEICTFSNGYGIDAGEISVA